MAEAVRATVASLQGACPSSRTCARMCVVFSAAGWRQRRVVFDILVLDRNGKTTELKCRHGPVMDIGECIRYFGLRQQMTKAITLIIKMSGYSTRCGLWTAMRTARFALTNFSCALPQPWIDDTVRHCGMTRLGWAGQVHQCRAIDVGADACRRHA